MMIEFIPTLLVKIELFNTFPKHSKEIMEGAPLCINCYASIVA